MPDSSDVTLLTYCHEPKPARVDVIRCPLTAQQRRPDKTCGGGTAEKIAAANCCRGNPITRHRGIPSSRLRRLRHRSAN